MKSIITIGIIFVILVGSASAQSIMDYSTAKEKITAFLIEDATNHRFNWTKTPSQAYAYHVARNASIKGIPLGRAYFANGTDKTIGYVFNYYVTSENYIMFIDPQTDKIVTWKEASARFKVPWKPSYLEYTTYYRYYPNIYNEGVGELPSHFRIRRD